MPWQIFLFDIITSSNFVYFVAGGVLSIVIAVFFGQAYVLISRKNMAREKYAITDIMNYNVRNNAIPLARLQLVKSSVKNACGFADMYKDKNKIIFRHYSFANNCFHNIIAPGSVLFDESVSDIKTESNEFDGIKICYKYSFLGTDVLPKKFQTKSSDCMRIIMLYTFPSDYVGPLYKSKELLFAKGIGLVHAVITYNTDQTNTFMLRNYKLQAHSSSWLPIENIGNYWVYDIAYFSGSANGPTKFNICEGK